MRARRFTYGGIGAVMATLVFAATAQAATLSPSSGPASGGTTTTITAPTSSAPQIDIAGGATTQYGIAPDGTLWIASPSGGATTAVTGGAAGKTFTSIDATGDSSAVAIASDGTVWSIAGGGMSNQITGPATGSTQVAAGYLRQYGIASDGSLWVAPAEGGAATAVTGGAAGKTFTGGVEKFDASGDINGNTGAVAIASDGTVWVVFADGSSSQITGPATGSLQVAATSTRVYGISPFGGQMWIASGGGAATPVTGVAAGTDFAALSAGGGGGNASAVAIANDGTMWSVDASGNAHQITGIPTTDASGNVDKSMGVSGGGSTQYISAAGGQMYVVPSTGGAATPITGGAAGKLIYSISAAGNINGVSSAIVNALDGTVWSIDASGGSHQITPPPLQVAGVTFGGVPATSFTQPSGGTYSAVTPAHAAGPVDVVVTTKYSNGTPGPATTIANGFTYIESADVPMVDPVVGLGAGVLALGAGAAVFMKRRRDALAVK